MYHGLWFWVTISSSLASSFACPVLWSVSVSSFILASSLLGKKVDINKCSKIYDLLVGSSFILPWFLDAAFGPLPASLQHSLRIRLGPDPSYSAHQLGQSQTGLRTGWQTRSVWGPFEGGAQLIIDLVFTQG